MASCELCGNDVNFLDSVRVSGSILKVCNSCKKLGEETIGTSSKSHTFRKYKRNDEIENEVVSNYPQIIQSALSKNGYTIHQLARETNIKESVLNNYMKKAVKLDVNTAQRIGKFLDINLVYEVEDGDDDTTSYMEDGKSSSGMSLGDMMQDLLKKNN